MKQLHFTGKIACALLLAAAAITGCKDKDPVQPPSPVVETPAATTPAPDASMTPPAATTPAPDAPAPAPAPATEPAPPAR